MKKIVENVPIFGYVEMYLLLEFDNGAITVCKNTMDFTKELRQDAFDLFASSAIAYYEENCNVKVVKLGYITKEKYEEIDKLLDDDKVVVQWNEDDEDEEKG